jgi:hypothetical protein
VAFAAADPLLGNDSGSATAKTDYGPGSIARARVQAAIERLNARLLIQA